MRWTRWRALAELAELAAGGVWGDLNPAAAVITGALVQADG